MKHDWTAWNKEREQFRNLETQGLEHDVTALEEHIKKLIEVAPKDNAGWIAINALDVINLLKRDLIKALVFLGQMPTDCD